MEYRRSYGEMDKHFPSQDSTIVIFSEDEAEYKEKFLASLRDKKEADDTFDFYLSNLVDGFFRKVIVNRYLEPETLIELAGGCPIEIDSHPVVNPKYL